MPITCTQRLSPYGVPITRTIPAYQLILPGGDLASVFNYEYRIPIVGPVTLAPFVDVGLDRIIVPSQLRLDPTRIEQLEQVFPTETFSDRAVIISKTEKPRVSTGLELQVLMPVVNAPFRLYWAYNLSYVNTNLQPPIAVNASDLGGGTYGAFLQGPYGAVVPFNERHSLFRFSVGRVF